MHMQACMCVYVCIHAQAWKWKIRSREDEYVLSNVGSKTVSKQIEDVSHFCLSDNLSGNKQSWRLPGPDVTSVLRKGQDPGIQTGATEAMRQDLWVLGWPRTPAWLVVKGNNCIHMYQLSLYYYNTYIIIFHGSIIHNY